MSKKRFTPNGETKQIYSNMKSRKTTLIVGLVATAAAFSMVLAALLILFVPSFAFKSGSISPFELNTYLYGIGACLAFLGIILSVAGANTSKGLAQLSFFFGICAFIVGLAMLLICLFFDAILPINAMRGAMI